MSGFVRKIGSTINVFLIRGGIFVLLFAVPGSALGQAQLKSSSYVLDDINFGTNFTLTTGQSSTPPQISAEGPTVIELTPTTAKITWKTDKKATSTILYGKTTDYGQETGNSDLVTEHTITIFGLTAETEYHFKAKSVDAFSSASTSNDKTFTTPAEAGINSIKITDITYDKALVSWTTGLFTLSKLEYGTSTAYGESISTSSRSFLSEHTIQLTDLKAGTEYHMRIVAEDEDGNITRSSDFIFSTIAEPRFVSISSKVSVNETVISWKTNVLSTAVLTYKSPKDTKDLSAGDSISATDHSLILKNLYGLTEYSFKITAIDSQGRKIESSNQTFTTLTDTDPPKVTDLKVAVTRSGEDLVLTVTWKTNEPSNSKVVYSPKTNPQDITDLPVNTSLVSEHVVVSTGINPSTPYTLKASSADAFGNQSEETINFVSPGLRKSILQLIFDNVLKSFGPFIKLFEGN